MAGVIEGLMVDKIRSVPEQIVVDGPGTPATTTGGASTVTFTGVLVPTVEMLSQPY